MSKLKVFCFGFGQVAEFFINKLIQEKKDFDLSITSRQETHQIEINNLKVSSFQFSQDKFDSSFQVFSAASLLSPLVEVGFVILFSFTHPPL